MRVHLTRSELSLLSAVAVVLCAATPDLFAQRQTERLGRGVVAVSTGGGRVFVGWRLLATDPDLVAFNVYRAGGASGPVKLNDQPLAGPTHFVDDPPDPMAANAYFVRPI